MLLGVVSIRTGAENKYHYAGAASMSLTYTVVSTLNKTLGLTCSNRSITPCGPKSAAADTQMAPRAVAARAATTFSCDQM
jgi:hypothetical protein